MGLNGVVHMTSLKNRLHNGFMHNRLDGVLGVPSVIEPTGDGHDVFFSGDRYHYRPQRAGHFTWGGNKHVAGSAGLAH